jgi:hypothetical protein
MVIGLDCAEHELVFGELVFPSRGDLPNIKQVFDAPDLSVFFGGLYWRSCGVLDGGKIHSLSKPRAAAGAINPVADGAGLNKCNVHRQRKQMIGAA